MTRSHLIALMSAFMFFTAGCASLSGTFSTTDLTVSSSRIAEIGRELEWETDSEKIAALLFERGHAYLDSAEILRASKRADEGMNAGGVEYATLILHALRDFEMVVNDFPVSAEAPEALFHLGAVYDYPNISSFGPALMYYRRTLSEYPGTDSAGKAEQAIQIIENNVKQVVGGEHGESG